MIQTGMLVIVLVISLDTETTLLTSASANSHFVVIQRINSTFGHFVLYLYFIKLLALISIIVLFNFPAGKKMHVITGW